MFKKVLFISSVLFCLLFLRISGECFADASALLEQAVAYAEDDDDKQAETLYKGVIKNYLGTDEALEAQTRLALLYIFSGRPVQAEEAFQAVLAGFSREESTPETVILVADLHFRLGKHQEALELFQYCLDKWPDGEQAIWSHLGVAISNIALGNDSKAQVTINKLLVDYSEHERLIEAFVDIADTYRASERYEEALQYYQYSVDHWPDDAENAIWAQSGVGMANAALGNDTAVQAAIDTLIADFNDHPRLPAAVSNIAESYYREAFRKESQGLDSEARDYFQKALALYKDARNKVPGFIGNADTYSWTGVCYRRLGEYEKSIECYQKVVDDYPKYHLAWYALFMVGRNNEDLKESGVISKSEAEPRIKAAYEKLLEEYPTCKAARIAGRWLSRYESR